MSSPKTLSLPPNHGIDSCPISARNISRHQKRLLVRTKRSRRRMRQDRQLGWNPLNRSMRNRRRKYTHHFLHHKCHAKYASIVKEICAVYLPISLQVDLQLQSGEYFLKNKEKEAREAKRRKEKVCCHFFVLNLGFTTSRTARRGHCRETRKASRSIYRTLGSS